MVDAPTNTTAVAFAHLNDMSYDELALKREQLQDTCLKDGVRDYASLSDAVLEELFEINRLMRRKNAGPPKPKKEATAKTGGIDDL